MKDTRQEETKANRIFKYVVPISARNQNESSAHCVPINPLSNNSFVVRLKIPYITRPFFFFVALYYYHLPMFVSCSLLRNAIPEDTHMISAIWHYSYWDHLQLSTYRWAFSVHKSSFVRPVACWPPLLCVSVFLMDRWREEEEDKKKVEKEEINSLRTSTTIIRSLYSSYSELLLGILFCFALAGSDLFRSDHVFT